MKSASPQYALKAVLARQLDWHGARISFLAHVIIALFQVKTVTLAELATALNGRVKPESNYKRRQRFLRGFVLAMASLARLVVNLMPLDEGPWFLTLDRTNWRFGRHEITILMLGIAYRGVAVPVMWTVLGKAGNSNTVERIALIERFVRVLGRERIGALLADREFVGCLKSCGFRFEDTPLIHPDRISKLMALLALAFVGAYRVGEIHSRRQPIPFKKLSTDPSSRCSAMASTESVSSCSISPINAPLSPPS